MDIQLNEARSLFTKRLVDVYSDAARPTRFFQALFTQSFSQTKEVSIEVRRNKRAIATDVFRGTGSRRNTFSISTEKLWVPPNYDEDFDATELDFYDRLFGTSMQGASISPITFAEWISSVNEHIMELEDKIMRAYELQASQVFFDGIVQLQAAANIDFKRKAASLLAFAAGHDWADNAIDPTDILNQGANFIKTEGKFSGAEYNVVMAEDVFQAMMNNTSFQAKSNLRRVEQVDLNMPQLNAEGAAFHGQVSGGSYRFNIWTYPEMYEDDAGTVFNYVPDKKLCIYPAGPTRYTQAFAAVPTLFRDEQRADFPQFVQMRRGAFHIDNMVDPLHFTHLFRLRSAGITIPTAVDTMFTVQVLA